MEIIQIISVYKKIKGVMDRGTGRYRPAHPLNPGYKRVMAIVREAGILRTRHIDIPK